MRRELIRGALVAALILGACSEGNDDDDSGASAPPTANEASGDTTTTESEEPSTAPLSTQQPYDGGTVNALEFTQPVAEGSPAPSEAGYPANYQWAGVDVEVCMPPDEDAVVSPAPWVLAYEDGTLAEPSHTGYSGFPQPAYPFGDQPVAAGQCVRGWIVFAAPAGTRPAVVQYAPAGPDSMRQWSVP